MIGGAIAASWRVVISRVGRIAIVGVGIMSLALIGAAIGVLRFVPVSSQNAREQFVAALADRLDAEVELQELRVHILPSLRAEGRGLTIRHKGRRDVPPLISVAHFSAESSVINLFRRHISRVDIDGLDIEIPPDRNRIDSDSAAASEDRAQPPGAGSNATGAFVVDELHSTSARLTIIPKDADSGALPHHPGAPRHAVRRDRIDPPFA